jgi:serine/threonine protein kinase
MKERDIFLAALEKDDATGRSAFLDETCDSDPELRRRMDLLLESYVRRGDSPLDVPPDLLALSDGGEAPPAEPTQAASRPPADPLSFLAPPARPDSLGRLAHYEVLEVLGRGGMGIVLRALDDQLQRVVALKVLAPHLAESDSARERFLREARASAAVRHPNVVVIHAIQERPVPYLVMEFIDGPTLQDRIRKSGPLTAEEIVAVGSQVAAGLAAAHRQGLIHRDVKPANILLAKSEEAGAITSIPVVKLVDFGLARAADGGALTQPGIIAGTPQFMSPEQAEGRPLDPRSDLFSLGSVLYAMCTGRPPFQADTAMGVLKRLCEGNCPPVTEVNAAVPEWLVRLIARLHARRPEDRPHSAAEVKELLERHLSVLPAPGASRPRRRLLLAGLLAVLACGLAAAAVIQLRTANGTVEIRTDDPKVKIIVEGEDATIIDPESKREIKLKAGMYRVRLGDGAKGLELETDQFELKRDGRVVVSVRRVPAAPKAAALSGQWTGLYTNDYGQAEPSALTVDEAADGTIGGLWDGFRISGRRAAPGTAEWTYTRPSDNYHYRARAREIWPGQVLKVVYTTSYVENSERKSFEGLTILTRETGEPLPKGFAFTGKWSGIYRNEPGGGGASVLNVTEGPDEKLRGTWDGKKLEGTRTGPGKAEWECRSEKGVTFRVSAEATHGGRVLSLHYTASPANGKGKAAKYQGHALLADRFDEKVPAPAPADGKDER